MVKKTVPIVPPSPEGRFDILLLRLGEAAFAWFDRRLNTGGALVNTFWHGQDGLRSVVEAKIDEFGVPREKLTPRVLAERAGFIKPRRLRRAG